MMRGRGDGRGRGHGRSRGRGGFSRGSGDRRGFHGFSTSDNYDDEAFDYQADRKARRKAEKVAQKRRRVEAQQQWSQRREQERAAKRQRESSVGSADGNARRGGAVATKSSRPGNRQDTKRTASAQVRQTPPARKKPAVSRTSAKPERRDASPDDDEGNGECGEYFGDETKGMKEDDRMPYESFEGKGDAQEEGEGDPNEDGGAAGGDSDDGRDADSIDGGHESDHSLTENTTVTITPPPPLPPRAVAVEVPKQLRVSLARCVNKLTMTNVVALTEETSDLLAGSVGASRAFVLAALVDQINRHCSADVAPLTQTGTMPFAGLLRALQLLHGAQVGAELVERLCWCLHDHLYAGRDGAAANLAMVLAHLYLLHGVDVGLIVSLLTCLVHMSSGPSSTTRTRLTPIATPVKKGLSSFSPPAAKSSTAALTTALTPVALGAADCGLTLLRACGEKLVREAPHEMTAVLQRMESAASSMRGQQVMGSARFQALVEVMKSIAAGHTRAGRRAHTEADAPVQKMLEDLCEVLPRGGPKGSVVHRRTQRRVVQTANTLRGLSWAQVTAVDKPPRWYARGAMTEGCSGGDGGADAANERDADDGAASEGRDGDSSDSSDSDDSEYDEHALKQEQIRRTRQEERAIAGQRLGTEHKREIFKAVASSTDDLECFTMLMQRDPGFTRFHDVCAVLIQCCCQEQRYNPYYTQVLERFCSAKSACKTTLQFALWDRLKSIRIEPKPDIVGYLNLACMMTSLLESGTFRLSLLRGLDLEQTNRSIGLFTRILLLRMLFQLPAARITGLLFGGDGVTAHDLKADTSSLRVCLQKFMNNHFMDEAAAARWMPLFYDVVAVGTPFQVGGATGGTQDGAHDTRENGEGSLHQFMTRVRVAYKALKQGIS